MIAPRSLIFALVTAFAVPVRVPFAIADSSAKDANPTKTLDKLRGDIESHWLASEDMLANPDVVVRVKFRLTRNGEIIGVPEVTASGGNATVLKKAMEGARRAVVRAAPYKLPPEKYDLWQDVEVIFHADRR